MAEAAPTKTTVFVTGARHVVISWQTGWLALLLEALPDGLYGATMKRARRPRGAATIGP